MRVQWSLITVVALIAVSADGRDRGQAAGAAIAPRLTLVGGPVSASVATRLQACITNDQRFSNAQLATGDALRITLSHGVLLDCVLEPGLPVVGDDSDWTCGVDGQSVEVSYLGAPRSWASDEVRCLRIDWIAPSATTTLHFESQPVIAGHMAPAEPATLVVPIGSPSGMGAGVGARAHLRSTDCGIAVAGEPPAVVPGLETTLEVAEGSQVAAWIDALALPHAFASGGGEHVVLLVDGVIVARQPLMQGVSVTGLGATANISFLTPAFSAGPHLFQVGVDLPHHAPGALSACLGSFDPDRATRLTLLEIQAN